MIVGPSGFGMPLTPLSKISEKELTLLTLVKQVDNVKPSLIGLRNVLIRLKNSVENVCLVPSVKLLPTVPDYRKVNKVDMGTADKVCCAALAIHDQASRLRIPVYSTSLVLVELGFCYNAFIGIENGKIVDGIGGTLGGMGFLSPGCFDGELTYLMGTINKSMLSRGGAASVAGMDVEPEPERFAEKVLEDERYILAWNAFLDAVEKGVASMLVSVRHPSEVLVSGRLARIPRIYSEVSKRLSLYGKVRRLAGFSAKVKEAAQGAALIANGLAGGAYIELVECMRLKEARGSVLDYIYLKNFEKIRKEFTG